MISKEIRDLADLVVDAHKDLSLDSLEILDETKLTSSNPVYLIAKLAANKLGFIEIDAECIANAWSKMTNNLNDWSATDWPDSLELFTNPVKFNPSPNCPKNLGLYVVAPSADWIKRLAEAGVKTLQLRFKSNDQDLIEQEVIESINAVKNTNTRLFINDYWELAIKHQAYGVHLGQEDLEDSDIQQIKAAGLHLGISTHGYAEMMIAHQHSPSYIALGAIFPTTLKRMKTAPQGTGRLYKYAALMKDYPLVGIGGIDLNNIDVVLNSGVGSIAVVRAIINAEKPLESIQAFQSHFSE